MSTKLFIIKQLQHLSNFFCFISTYKKRYLSFLYVYFATFLLLTEMFHNCHLHPKYFISCIVHYTFFFFILFASHKDIIFLGAPLIHPITSMCVGDIDKFAY